MLNNFFTGSENLFKLLFINGILIILVGLFYPLQKRDELDIKIIEYNSSVEILNKEIGQLYYESNSLLAEIKSQPKAKIKNQAKAKEFKTKIFEQDKKAIILEGQKKRIEALEKQQQTYNAYCMAFLIFGGVITILGLLGWLRLTYFEYDKEYSDYRIRNASSNTIRKSTILFVLIACILISALITTLLIIINK